MDVDVTFLMDVVSSCSSCAGLDARCCVGRPRREFQLRVVLIFLSPRFFPSGFSWEGFLRRQSQLDRYPPYKVVQALA
nr:hypothetical protein [Tanacetum cinerariifolium]